MLAFPLPVLVELSTSEERFLPLTNCQFHICSGRVPAAEETASTMAAWDPISVVATHPEGHELQIADTSRDQPAQV